MSSAGSVKDEPVLRRISRAVTEQAVQAEPLGYDAENVLGPGPRLSMGFGYEPVEKAHRGPEDAQRTGTEITVIAHIVTAVIGSGVLALPATVAQLGWVAGILLQLLFAYITWQTSILLADCHVVDGVRQHTYSDMVYTVMGKRGFVVLAIVQQVNLFLGALSYNITAGSNMQSFATSICAVHGTTDCFDTYWKMAIIFGAVQLIVVQLPDLNYFWWVSVGGFVTAVVYSGIGFGLSVAQTNTQGTVGGVDETPAQKGFGVLNGIGAILFSYGFAIVQMEIQDCLKDDPVKGVVRPMKRAIHFSIGMMTIFYLAVSIAGYMALGNSVPGNILDGFSSPHWLVQLARFAVILHMVCSAQIYLQPFLVFVEYYINNVFLTSWKKAPLQRWTVRLISRTFFVVVITVISICIPFFGDVIGLVGSVGFWPATVFFPIECYIRIFKPTGTFKAYLRALNVFSCLVTLAGVVGSVRLIVVDSKDYSVFS